MFDAKAYFQNPRNHKPSIELSEIENWYENMSQPEYENKLIFRYDKTIPPVVQETLERIGFVEWDLKQHGEDNWNLYWKNAR